jgi:hypothetical protein
VVMFGYPMTIMSLMRRSPFTDSFACETCVAHELGFTTACEVRRCVGRLERYLRS